MIESSNLYLTKSYAQIRVSNDNKDKITNEQDRMNTKYQRKHRQMVCCENKWPTEEAE